MERSLRPATAVFALVILAAIGWAYWGPLGDMARKWATDPQYSQGYAVPLFSAFLIWRRRHELAEEECQPTWWGAALMLVGVAVRLLGTFIYMDWLEGISLLPLLWGAALLLVGWRGLWHTWFAVAFLFFMIPLPYRIETALSLPLQRVATLTSTYTLQTLGFPAFAEGNVIVLNAQRIGIIEACNGLGMLMLFFALALAVAILINRPLLDKILLVAAALPIAVLANTFRITTTTIISEKISEYWGNKIFHDYGGPVMMPVALLMLWLVLVAIDLVLTKPDDEREMVAAMYSGGFQAPV